MLCFHLGLSHHQNDGNQSSDFMELSDEELDDDVDNDDELDAVLFSASLLIKPLR